MEGGSRRGVRRRPQASGAATLGCRVEATVGAGCGGSRFPLFSVVGLGQTKKQRREAGARRRQQGRDRQHHHRRRPPLLQGRDERCVSCTTFNILAPIYKRMDSENCRESQYRAYWFSRNEKIIDRLLVDCSSIICLQEVWLGNDELVDMYEKRLGNVNYTLFKLARTNNRGDGKPEDRLEKRQKKISIVQLTGISHRTEIGRLMGTDLRGEEDKTTNSRVGRRHERDGGEEFSAEEQL